MGWSWTVNYPDTHAFLFTPGGLSGPPSMGDLGTFGGSDSVAQAINDSGQVTGYSEYGDGTARAFLYSGGVMNDLGVPAGYSSTGTSVGYAINSSGQVAGYAQDGSLQSVLFSGGAVTLLDPTGVMGQSVARGINDSGQVVGFSYSIPGAFVYSDGVITNLNSLIDSPGVSMGNAWDINNLGQITGCCITANGDAVLLTPLPEPSKGLLELTGLMGLLSIARWCRTNI